MDRFIEVDFLRGIAVILMVLFHAMYDLHFFGISSISPFEGALFWIGRTSGFLFMLVVGISLTLSFSKTGYSAGWLKYFLRGAWVFGLGCFVTIVTLILFPSSPIWFGALHLIGTSVIIAYPFLKLGWQNIIFASIAIIIGFLISNHAFDFWYLLPLGFTPYNFSSLDYYPLFPWFGVILIGVFVGNLLYKDYKRNFNFPNIKIPFSRSLSFLGRNSLLIYFSHQPLILFLLYIYLHFIR